MALQPGSGPSAVPITPGIPPSTSGVGVGIGYDKDGNLVDAQGNIVQTAAQLAATGAANAGATAQIDKNLAESLKPDLVTDLVTRDNPVAGTVNAAGQLANGHLASAASDFAGGVSFGTLPQVDQNGNITPGDTTKAAADAIGLPQNIPGVTSKLPTGEILDAVGNVVDSAGNVIAKAGSSLADALGGLGGTSIDTTSAKSDHDRAMNLADALNTQANTAGQQAGVDRTLGYQTRGQQEQSIQGLQDAANGNVASAAEIQGKNQAAIDSARQFGMAAALQGNNPAAALRQASLGAAAVNGTNNANAAALRANEQANARTALASTLGNVRSADTANVNTDVGQQTNLNSAGLTSQGQGVTSTGQQLTAQTEKAKADALKQGALIGAGGTTIATLLSDKRSKKNVAKAGLADALGAKVPSVTFEYIKPEDDAGPQFGVMADDLERVIPGVVKKRSDGMKVVDTGHLTMGNTAILSELARRIKELEKGKRK